MSRVTETLETSYANITRCSKWIWLFDHASHAQEKKLKQKNTNYLFYNFIQNIPKYILLSCITIHSNRFVGTKWIWLWLQIWHKKIIYFIYFILFISSTYQLQRYLNISNGYYCDHTSCAQNEKLNYLFSIKTSKKHTLLYLHLQIINVPTLLFYFACLPFVWVFSIAVHQLCLFIWLIYSIIVCIQGICIYLISLHNSENFLNCTTKTKIVHVSFLIAQIRKLSWLLNSEKVFGFIQLPNSENFLDWATQKKWSVIFSQLHNSENFLDCLAQKNIVHVFGFIVQLRNVSWFSN